MLVIGRGAVFTLCLEFTIAKMLWNIPWESQKNSPANLNSANRPVRTRMPGGVAGDAEPNARRPYADRLGKTQAEIFASSSAGSRST
jgi:hypothetical protein